MLKQSSADIFFAVHAREKKKKEEKF